MGNGQVRRLILILCLCIHGCFEQSMRYIDPSIPRNAAHLAVTLLSQVTWLQMVGCTVNCYQYQCIHFNLKFVILTYMYMIYTMCQVMHPLKMTHITSPRSLTPDGRMIDSSLSRPSKHVTNGLDLYNNCLLRETSCSVLPVLLRL